MRVFAWKDMRKCSASFLARAVPLVGAGSRNLGNVSVNCGQKHSLFTAGAVSNPSSCGLVMCRRGLCSSEKHPLDFWLLPETKIGLDEIETKVEAYRQAPSPASLDAVQSVISVERHALELNGRVHGMLQSAGSGASERLNTEDAVRGCAYILQGLILRDFSHIRLGKGTAPVRMEELRKEFSIRPSGGGESIEMKIEWELSRRQMPGLIEHAYAAKVVANGTRIIDISEVHDSVSEDSLNSIQEHVGAALSVSKEDFRWLMATLLTYPSDDAFDVVSAKLIGTK